MKNNLKIVFYSILGMAFILIVFLFLFVNDAENSMHDNAIHYSNGIEESKKNNLFLGYYRPLKDSVILDNWKSKTVKIWYEKNWTTDHSLFSKKKIKINSGITIIARYTFPYSSDRNFGIGLKKKGIKGWDGLFIDNFIDGYIGLISNCPDTITLLFTSTTGFHKGETMKEFEDTIKYVRE